jgi:hypothetical protein
MTAISILAMAMVICLFGGYFDSADEHGFSTAARLLCQKFTHKPEATKRRSSS